MLIILRWTYQKKKNIYHQSSHREIFAKGSGSVNMQLIRAINKSNKSNNTNMNNNKVVVIVPPKTSSAMAASSFNSQMTTSVAGDNNNAPQVSPNVSLPALKKRTSIIKQSVPPPVPPRGSPRSKSKSFGVRRRNEIKSSNHVDRFESLQNPEQSGYQKVEKWLKTVEVHNDDPDRIAFKDVKQLIQSFSQRNLTSDPKCLATSVIMKGRKVFDSNMVRSRIECYNSLECGFKYDSNQTLQMSNEKLAQTINQFCRDDGKFVWSKPADTDLKIPLLWSILPFVCEPFSFYNFSMTTKFIIPFVVVCYCFSWLYNMQIKKKEYIDGCKSPMFFNHYYFFLFLLLSSFAILIVTISNPFICFHLFFFYRHLLLHKFLLRLKQSGSVIDLICTWILHRNRNAI